MTLASYITLLRIFLIIPIIYLTSLNIFIANIIALVLFIVAAVSDSLDGYIARKTQTETDLGALLDLVADKLLVCLLLIWLVSLNNSLFFVLPVLIIVLRELSISSLRQNIAESQVENNIQVSKIGKSKTTMQFIAIGLIVISPEMSVSFYNLALFFLWLSSAISLISFYVYVSRWIQSSD